MANNKCSECKFLPAHHECTICRLVLVCPECCNKRGISDLNAIACKDCQTRDASHNLAQPSDGVAMTVNSELVELESLEESSDFNQAAQETMINETQLDAITGQPSNPPANILADNAS